MASPQAEPAFDSKALRLECKMYVALQYCATGYFFIICSHWLTVSDYLSFRRAFVVTSVFASIASVGILFLRFRFLRWSATRQAQFLYSRDSKRVVLIGVVGATVLMLLPIILAGPVVLSHRLLLLTHIGPAAFMAIALFIAGSKFRVGTSIHCAFCEYERGTPPQGVAMSPTCPECGKRWLVRGGTVIGKISPDRSLILASVLYMMIPVGLFPMQFAGVIVGSVNPGINWSSKESLIRLAKTGGLESKEVWDELATRTLDSEEVDELIRAILELTPAGEYTDLGANDWIHAVARANRIQSEQFVALLSRKSVTDSSSSYWTYVSDFEFTPDQMAQIGEHAIEFVTKNGYLPFDARTWLRETFDKGLFPDYVNERLKPYLDP